MAPSRQAAPFVPISPHLDVASLVEQTENFEYVARFQCEDVEANGLDVFDGMVRDQVIKRGLPVIIEGYQRKLEQWTFSTQWLKDNHGRKPEVARDLKNKKNIDLSIGHYVDNLPKLTNQIDIQNYKQPDRQRIYLKDIDCPQLWHDKLKETLPPGIFYLNESTGDYGGPGSLEEPNAAGNGSRKGRGVAHAGDLMANLPIAMRAENLMCYIGHEGTYTPAHREMCASLGQNIMVEASGIIDEAGGICKAGSSIWFMTETKDRHVVSEYWLSTLGHDIEVESHFGSLRAWMAAPFKVYVVEQKPGDLLLIPPLAPHQVWNRGTRTMKVAWNRTTVETLEMAINEALPRARMVCRDEQYKNKAIILFSLHRYSGLLYRLDDMSATHTDDELDGPKVRQLRKDFKRLFTLYTKTVVSEMFPPGKEERKVEYNQYDSNVTCSYCRCNIFNRFLTCQNCIITLDNGDEAPYDVCLDCYAMGRSCKCISKLTWVEQFPWQHLVDKHNIWASQIEAYSSKPLGLVQEYQRSQKKTLAEICQEQLKSRPFVDITKPQDEADQGPLEDDSDDGLTANGTPRKVPRKRLTEKQKRDSHPCHTCCHRDSKWKMALCTECGTGFCYGVMWRGFDTMPQTIMENPKWRCPKCENICPCTHCKKLPGNNPYQPKGTTLGHDTKKIADERSTESLVDFSNSNKHWLSKSGEGDDTRLARHTENANQERELEDYPSDNEQDLPHLDAVIDPSLLTSDQRSRLEQDPAGFAAQAGLSFDQFINPASIMSAPYEEIDFAEDRFDHNAEGPRPTKKRKRKEGEIDEEYSVANKSYQRKQNRKVAGEAKKQGRGIALAGIKSGEKKMIKLKLAPSKLARFYMADSNKPTEVETPVDFTPMPTAEPVVDGLQLGRKAKPKASKGRNRNRSDDDDDDEEDGEGESDDDMEMNFDVATPAKTNGVSNGPKRRSLPAYLAQRSPAPEELPTPPARTVKPKPKASVPTRGGRKSMLSRTTTAIDLTDSPRSTRTSAVNGVQNGTSRTSILSTRGKGRVKIVG